jgi:hypothetical protein
MVTEEQLWQHNRRIAERFLNVTVANLLSAVNAKNSKDAYRAATDLAQVTDDLLSMVGAPDVHGGVDCPDCGQYVPDAIDILTEGEGE